MNMATLETETCSLSFADTGAITYERVNTISGGDVPPDDFPRRTMVSPERTAFTIARPDVGNDMGLKLFSRIMVLIE